MEVQKTNEIRKLNFEFARDNKDLAKACQKVGIEPTRRQASKWRNGKGLAYKRGRF